MSDTTELSYGQGKMLTYDAALILDAIAADLRQGSLPLASAGEAVPARVTLPATAKIEIEFKGKVKPGKSKHKLAIEITWKEKEEAPEKDKIAAAPEEAASPRIDLPCDTDVPSADNA